MDIDTDDRANPPPRDDAFDEFVRRTREPLRRALVAMYGVEIGEDAAAEALRIGWERWDEIGTMENPAGYLFRVGQSKARPALRWWRRRSRFPLRDPSPREDAHPSDHDDVYAALATLRPEERAAILLVRSHGYSYAEAADLVGVSESAITNHLHRGMQRLRDELGVMP